MIDETGNQEAGQVPEQVGFCQDCGKPLTRETVRAVGSGVFCEPCLEARVNTGAAAGTPPPPGTMPPIGGDNPSPVLAALLGLIPGVGAMYNGQFAKGIAHIVIFALLDSMAHVSGVFGLLVAGWIFYQSFEAYHTAQARRDGLPLPDPFGLNNIGEQMGVHFRGTAAGAPPTNAGGYPGAGYTGYVRPPIVTPPPSDPAAQPVASAWGSAPAQTPMSAYTQPVAGPQQPAWTTSPLNPPQTPDWGNTAAYYPDVNARARRFPCAAIWLIGFGLLFLILNFVPEWRFSLHKAVPIFLMALGVGLFFRRMNIGGAGYGTYGTRAICALRGPVILFTIGFLLALQAFGIFSMGRTWPVLVIVIGLTLMVERSIGNRAVPLAAAPADAAPTGGDGKVV